MIFWFEETTSTQEFLKSRIEQEDEIDFAVAKKQISGKGRMGRVFVSNSGGVYLSASYKINAKIKEFLKVVTPAMAVYLREIINTTLGKQTEIKWINDLYYERKKVAGIIAETSNNRLIIGIGVNYINQDFGEFQKRVTSLYKPDEKAYPIEGFIKILVEKLKAFFTYIQKNDWLSLYVKHSFVINKNVVLVNPYTNAIIISGKCIGFDEKGAIMVEDKATGEVKTIGSGEISLKFD